MRWASVADTPGQAQVASSHGLRALAIHEDTVREAHLRGQDLVQDLFEGDDVRLGVMSPQMLRSSRILKFIKEPKLKSLVRWMLIDEVHLCDQKDETFVVAYKAIAPMRSLLLSTTIWAAVTGTATPDRALSMARTLGFQPGHYVNARYSVDRPTIKYIPRFFQHAASGNDFLDLSFLIPFQLTSIDQIEPSLVFSMSINRGHRLMRYLDNLIPANFPHRLEIIKLYNSLKPAEYRKKFLQDIESNTWLRIGIVTDTCTYGLDIKNLRRVIVSDMCPSHANLKQKMGRPGRDGLPATAITYAPSWVKAIPAADVQGVQQKEDAKRRAKLPLITQQWYNPSPALCSRAADLKDNAEPFNPATCQCSIHQPDDADLLEVERWRVHFQAVKARNMKALPRSDGTYPSLEKPMKASLTHMLERWKHQKWFVLRGNSLGRPADVFLPRRIITQIVEKAHICSDHDRFDLVVGDWSYLASHGEELFKYLTEIMQGFKQVVAERAPADTAVENLDSNTPDSNADTDITVDNDIREPLDMEPPLVLRISRPARGVNEIIV